MTLVDFIELNDDIIDLSSDEESVEDDHIINQHGAISPDRQAMFVLAGEGSQEAQAVFIAPSEGRQEATDSRNALEVTASSLDMERSPLDTDESQSCPPFATSAPFPSPTATTPKALTSEGSDTKLVTVKKYRGKNKNYHTGTPRRSPRFEHKGQCCNSPVEELVAEQKSSRMLELAEEPAPSTDNSDVVN